MIGNTIQTNTGLLDSRFLLYFHICLGCLWKRLLPYWRQGIYDQLSSGIRDSLSNISSLQKKSLNSWTCLHVTGPKNTLIWVWNMKKLEIRFHESHIFKKESWRCSQTLFQNLKKILEMLTNILCRLAVTLFQTS